MKHIIFVAGLALALSYPPAFAEAQIKEVCKDAVGKDGKPVMGKDGKPKQDCKKIKVHKKAETVTTGSPTDPVKKEEQKKK
jgi:hypothetical protein